MIQRGSIHWADLGAPHGSGPGKRRPLVVLQADRFTNSRLATVVTAVLTSNTRLAAMPGNVIVPTTVSGLPRDSIVNVTAVITIDRVHLEPPVGLLPLDLMRQVDQGLRLVLGL